MDTMLWLEIIIGILQAKKPSFLGYLELSAVVFPGQDYRELYRRHILAFPVRR